MQVSGRTLRLSQPLTTALFPDAKTEDVSTKAATIRFVLSDDAGRSFSMTLVFKRYKTGYVIVHVRFRCLIWTLFWGWPAFLIAATHVIRMSCCATA